MSIVDKRHLQTYHPDTEHICFLCGEDCTGPVIFWMGEGVDLVLHPPCATSLILRLAIDLRRFEKMQEQEQEQDGHHFFTIPV